MRGERSGRILKGGNRAERGRILDLVGGLVQNLLEKNTGVGKAKWDGRVFRMSRHSTIRLHCSKTKCYDSPSIFGTFVPDAALNGPLHHRLIT